MKQKVENQKDTGKHLLDKLSIGDVSGQSEQLHFCKYVKRFGESCTLNNNCKYPNCADKP